MILMQYSYKVFRMLTMSREDFCNDKYSALKINYKNLST